MNGVSAAVCHLPRDVNPVSAAAFVPEDKWPLTNSHSYSSHSKASYSCYIYLALPAELEFRYPPRLTGKQTLQERLATVGHYAIAFLDLRIDFLVHIMNYKLWTKKNEHLQLKVRF